MTQSTMIHVRMDAATKKAAEAIFSKLGLSTSDAVRMFFHSVKREKGIPFGIKIPNAETRKAMEEIKQGKTETMTLEAFKKSLGL
jgi:DNA-damage-inducible protein J